MSATHRPVINRWSGLRVYYHLSSGLTLTMGSKRSPQGFVRGQFGSDSPHYIPRDRAARILREIRANYRTGSAS